MKKQALPDSLAKHWMYQDEAARELGVTIKTVWEWRKAGTLQACKHAGRVLIRRSDVRKKLMHLEPA